MKKTITSLFIVATITAFSQSIYLSGPGIVGETTSGTHANETPIDAYSLGRDFSTNNNGDIYVKYTVKFRKKINKSTIQLFSRVRMGNVSGPPLTSHDYTFKFYDSNDNNYFTVELKSAKMSSSFGGNDIIIPECNTSGCQEHYEEWLIEVFPAGAGIQYVTLKNNLTGETKTLN